MGPRIVEREALDAATEVAVVRAERDRYRTALELIATGPSAREAMQTARDALSAHAATPAEEFDGGAEEDNAGEGPVSSG